MDKITLELDKDDVLSLVIGSSPNYNIMNDMSSYGDFNGSYGTWTWSRSKLENCSLTDLVEIYKKVKRSWAK